jgi:hypothetical protein
MRWSKKEPTSSLALATECKSPPTARSLVQPRQTNSTVMGLDTLAVAASVGIRSDPRDAGSVGLTTMMEGRVRCDQEGVSVARPASVDRSVPANLARATSTIVG